MGDVFPSPIADTVVEAACNNITADSLSTSAATAGCAARYDLTSARECDNVRLIRRQVWRAEALWSLGLTSVETRAMAGPVVGRRCRALSADFTDIRLSPDSVLARQLLDSYPH